jgi:O-antigen ligase
VRLKEPRFSLFPRNQKCWVKRTRKPTLPIYSSFVRRFQNDLDVGPALLVLLILIYPLVFVPGALFSSPPPVINDAVRTQMGEQFLFLPKLVVLGLFAVLALLESRKHSWRSVWVGLLAAHLVLVGISGLNARDDIAFTLLGGSQRLDGLIYQATLVIIGVFAYQTLQRHPGWLPRVLFALVGAAVLQSILAVVQYVGIDPIGVAVLWFKFERPVGTIGHPGMVAGLLLPATVIATWFVLEARDARSRWVWGLALLSLVIGLSVVSNRSALIALAVGLVMLVVYRRSLISAVLVVAVSVLALSGRQIIPNAGVLPSNLASTQTLGTREVIWNMALQAIVQTLGQPFIGGGPDAFHLWMLRSASLQNLTELIKREMAWPANAKPDKVERVQLGQSVRTTGVSLHFDKFGERKDFNLVVPIEVDRAHNLILDRTVAYGGLSALIWLGLYLLPVLAGLRDLFARRESQGEAEAAQEGHGVHAVFACAILGLIVYYITWFPVMQLEPLHLILLAGAWVTVLQPQVVPLQVRTLAPGD